jgi:hypothetical protein
MVHRGRLPLSAVLHRGGACDGVPGADAMDEPPPPARRLRLKPKEVAPLDTVARPGDGTAISVQLIHRENKLAADKRAGIETDPAAPHPGSAAIPLPPPRREEREMAPPAEPDPGRQIDVRDMLRGNAAANQALGELVAMPKRRTSRRRQDFAAILVLAGGAAALLLAFFRHDPEIVALGLFAIGFATAVVSWLIFGMMDRY